MNRKRAAFKNHLYQVPLAFAALLVLSLAIVPLLIPSKTGAAGQISNRSLSISSGVPGATGVSYSWTFTINSTTPINGLKFIACDTAVGTYGREASSTCASGAAPVNLSFSSGPAAFVSQTGFADNGNSFVRDGTGAAYCTPSANVLCASRSGAVTAETATSRTITFNAIRNPNTTNSTFFVGIYTYNATSSSTALDSGTTASAVVQTLTTNAAVAEILNFCVGSTSVDDAISDPTPSGNHDCSVISGTAVDLGTLDTSQVSITPVSTNCTAADCNLNGIAMLRTNAVNGATISYDAIQQSGANHQGTLRISGATCNTPGNNNIDQCINAAGATQASFTAGAEEFGMTIAGVNCGSTSSYTCAYLSGTNNLKQSAQYIGDASSTAYGASASKGFAWDETGTSQQIASSTTVVDDEALILKFAATPSITTPFGAYTAQSDYIAVATY